MGNEFYRDEFPKPLGGGGGSGGGGGGGGGWGGFGGGGGGGGGYIHGCWKDFLEKDDSVNSDTGDKIKEGEEEEIWYLLGTWNPNLRKILLNGRGKINRHKGKILIGSRGCYDIQVYCQVRGEDPGAHVSCLVLSWELDGKEFDGQEAFFLDKLDSRNATLTIKVKWQDGHYPHASINTVRFKILNQKSGWIYLSMTEFTKIATLDIRNGQLHIGNMQGA
ncbi:MAG: hypothetical protein IKB77_04620 [Lentisphaeria bacterium]|nr:hypothetical protein [Lentisphaeria bacterium]